MSSSIKPTLSVPIFGGEVTVHAFGREHGCDFSFRGIDASPNATESHRAIFDALASIPAACDYLAPSPARMNAELVRPFDLRPVNENGHVWEYPRPATSYGPFKLYRGAYADGLTNMNAWNGYVMSSADCALVVVKAGNLIIASHAGRDSVIDTAQLKGQQPRKIGSVVENILLHIGGKGRAAQNAHVWIGFSISPGPHFAHVKSSTTHPHNRILVNCISSLYGKECFADDGEGGERGWLDLKELIRRQFMFYGVPEGNITTDAVCTNTDMKDGEYMWYSNRRQAVQGEEQKRNLVAVVKNP